MPLLKTTPASVTPESETHKSEGLVPYTGRQGSTDTDKMSKADWAAKDRRISRQGLYQAALQSMGVLQYSPSVNSLETYLQAVRKAAEDGLKFVEGQ